MMPLRSFALVCAAGVILVHMTVAFVSVQEIVENAIGGAGGSTSFLDYHYTSSVEELIERENYPLEIHTTKTEDGYTLKMHRIPYGRAAASSRTRSRRSTGSHHQHGWSNHTTGRPIVFLMHGLMLSSADWVLMGSDKGLAYILADAGYDVWMGNARGNVHSRQHDRLDPSSHEFWEFSWHEMGVYDLPAMIDHMLNVTGETGVHYIGYSQGCTVFFVMASERPEYNAKIRSMQALGPAAFLSNTANPVVRACMSMMDGAEWLSGLFGVYQSLPSWSGRVVSLLGRYFCNDDSLMQGFCLKVFFSSGAFTSKQLNSTMLPTIMSHMPAGASFRQLLHFGQAIKTGTFRHYDHGDSRNREIYGRPDPPDYDLRQITAPVALHWSHNDDFTILTDVEILGSKLGNLIGLFEVADSSFTHFDYLWANEAHEYLYKKMIEIMGRY